MTTHLDRKALKRPDAFLERAGGFMSLVSDNMGAFVVGVVILFIAGLGFAFYNNHAQHVAETSDAALFEASTVLDAAQKKLEAPGASGAPAAATDAWKTATLAGVDAVEKVTKDFSGTRAAFEANLMLGDFFFKHADFEKAASYYKQGVDAARPRSSKPAALYSLAYAYESAKNYDAAIETLRQVVASDSATYKPDALLALGRVYELKGDKPKALEAYSQASKDYANSPIAKQADTAAARVR